MSEHGDAVCAVCTGLYIVNKSDQWWRWLCIHHPLPQVYNPVTGATVADPPYRLCRHVNDGTCEDFEEGVNSLRPKEMANVHG